MVGILTNGTKKEDPFASAVSEFIDSLTPSEKSIFQATTAVDHLLADAALANANHEATSRSRALTSQLRPLMEGVLQYESALNVFAGSNNVLGPIWGCLRIVLHLATEFGDYFDKLANMFEQIGYNLSRLRRYPRLYPDNEQLMKALVEVYKHVIKFCTKARAVFTEGKSKKGRCKISKSDAILMTKLTGVRKVFESTGLRTAMKLLWKPFKQQFGDTQDGMAFYIDIIELEVSAAEKEEAHNERAKAENERVLQTVHRQKNERHLEDAERFFEEHGARRMIDWLSPANVEANHRAATTAKQEGTGSWFLENPIFTKWLDDGDRGLMWLYAIPGAGKTVLASSIINHLTATRKSSDVGVIYFYCDYKEPQQQCPTRILATLLAMLSTQNKAAFMETQSYFQKQFKDNPAYQISYDELRNVFPIVARQFRQVLVVIDALDESASDRACFIKTLLELSDEDSGCIKTLVTSRNVYDIADAFRGLPTVCIGKNDIAADIENYITAQIKDRIEDRKLKLRDASLEQEIISVLQHKAEGMFQWVKCQIQYLCSMRSDKAIRAALLKLPKDLDDTYFRILEHVKSLPDDESICNVQKVLRWLVHGNKSLTLPEIAEAISIDLEDKESCERMDFSAVMTEPEDVLEYCGSLVTVTDDMTVSLAHYSVKEFLVSDRVKDAMVGFYMGGPEVSIELATTCLTYLCFEDFEQVPESDEELEEKLEEYKFLRCAAHSWAEHSAECKDKNDPSVQELTLKLLTLGNGNFEFWRMVYHYRGKQRRRDDVHEEPLYFASLFGLCGTVQALIDNDEATLKGGELQAAASEGHAEIVKVLLKFCDPEEEEEEIARSLYFAAFKGHDKVVALLLNKGANTEFKGRRGTPLQVAAFEGRLKVVELLLRNGANLKAKHERFGTPLHTASEKGHEKIVRELLRKGADPNRRGGWYCYPLQSAIVAQSEAIVKLLLNSGAEVNATGGRHQHALIAAADLGNLKLVKLLIERGAEVNDHNEKGADALHAACCGGYLDVVELLIENGADVNARGGKCRNALNAASTHGHPAIVEKLLEAGADLHFRDSNYGDALQAAARRGHNEVIKVLHKAGAKLNNRGSAKHGTAIVCAAFNGHVETIRLLFELGLRKGSKRENNKALVTAVYRRHTEVIRTLVEFGANINGAIQTRIHEDLCTPLQVAALEGDEETVRLLLSLGADVNVIAGVYGSALSAAIVSEERSAGEVVDILLEAGANVNAIGCQQYGTPLTAAVRLERKAIAYKLLRRGANPNLIVPERINAVEHAVAIAGHTGDEELLDMLLEYEADINIFHEVSFDYDSTPLQSVCGYGNKMLVRKLILKHKANICIGRECRRLGRSHQVSALVRACVNGHIDVAQILIGLGADVNVRGGCYGTPLQATIAIFQGENDIFDVLNFLIDHGADVNAETGLDGSPLIAAVAQGREDIVRFLVKKGANINAVTRGRHGFALQEAAVKDNTSMLRLLLSLGADSNLTGGLYHTALQAACLQPKDDDDDNEPARGEENDWEDDKTDDGVNRDDDSEDEAVDSSNDDEKGGSTAEEDAAEENEKDEDQDDGKSAYEILVEAGADVNANGGKFGTALQTAHSWGAYDVLSYLLDHGASRNLAGGNHHTALGGALAGSCNGILSVYWTRYALQEDANLDFANIPGGQHGPPLHHAIQDWTERSAFCYNLINQMKADINLNDKTWGTPLIVACSVANRDPEVMEEEDLTGLIQFIHELVDRGADVNARGGNYGNALQACVNGPLELATYLLEKGCDVNAIGGASGLSSPLSRAALMGETDMVRLFLEHDANPNIGGGKWGFALHAAANEGHIDIAELLVKHGANVNLRHKRYGSPLAAAMADPRHFNPALIDFLLENGADVDTQGGRFGCPLTAAALGGYDDVAAKLVAKGANVNQKGGRFGYPLQAAAVKGSVKTVSLLLENGADINAVGGSYGTALVAAVANGREAVAQLLIDHGVSKSDAGDWWRNMRIHKRKRHAELAKRFLDIDKFYFETFISLQNGLSVASDM